MDLQTAKEEDALMTSQNEVPITLIDVILSNDLDNDTESEVKIHTEENHAQTLNNFKEENDEKTKVVLQEEEKKEHLDEDCLRKFSSSQEGPKDKEVVEHELGHTTTGGHDDVGSTNGEVANNTSQKNEIDIMWTEAIKAQNDGNYKHAIRKFTAILEVSCS